MIRTTRLVHLSLRKLVRYRKKERVPQMLRAVGIKSKRSVRNYQRRNWGKLKRNDNLTRVMIIRALSLQVFRKAR
jgi:hypothetical protein